MTTEWLKKCSECGRMKFPNQFHTPQNARCVLCMRTAPQKTLKEYRCLGSRPSGGDCNKLVRSREGFRLCWSCKNTAEWRDGEIY